MDCCEEQMCGCERIAKVTYRMKRERERDIRQDWEISYRSPWTWVLKLVIVSFEWCNSIK
jgi:hypothetical protein